MQIRYFWTSNSVQARCPSCQVLSTTACHDYYTKDIQDIPFNNKAVYHVIPLNKFFCGNPECGRNRFFERFPGFTEERARKTTRFIEFGIKRSSILSVIFEIKVCGISLRKSHADYPQYHAGSRLLHTLP